MKAKFPAEYDDTTVFSGVPASGTLYCPSGAVSLYEAWSCQPSGWTVTGISAVHAITYDGSGGSGYMPRGVAADGVPIILPYCAFSAPEGGRTAPRLACLWQAPFPP